MAPARPNWLAYDWGLVFLVAAIVALGFVNLGSAAPDPALLYRQSVALGLGLLLAFLLQFLSRRRLFGLAYPLYGASLLLLALVLVVGREINGARAWFVLGPLQFQPLELAKLGLLLALAKALEGRPIARVWDYALPALLTLPVVGLLLLQPDLGGALVVLFGVFVVVFVRGLPWRHLLVGLFALALACPRLSDRLFLSGFAGMLGFQVVVNLGVALGVMPVTGLTLPLFSYGGSSLIATLAGLGLVLLVHRDRYQD